MPDRSKGRPCAAPPARHSDLHGETAVAIVQWAQRKGVCAGTRLREQHLGDALGLSRSPVRGALALLARHGLAEARSGRGYILLLHGTALDERAALLPVTDADETYRQIARDWFEGTIPEQVSAAEVQRRYGGQGADVTRALKRLADDGVIKRMPGKGWRLGPNLATEADFLASYHFRQVIEPAAILIDSFALNASLAARARVRHQRLLTHGALASVKEMVDADLEFHHLIGTSCGNPFLAHAINRQNTLRRLTEMLTTPDCDRLRISCEEHMGILSAIESGEKERAAALMHSHLAMSQTFTPAWIGQAAPLRVAQDGR